MIRFMTFVKDTVLDFLTVIPALFVAGALYVPDGTFGSLIALIITAFIFTLALQSILMLIFRTHRHWVNSLMAMVILLVMGLFMLDLLQDPSVTGDYTEVESSVLLNIATEFLGASVIVILLQLKRIGVAGAMVVGVIFFTMIDRSSGFDVEVYINLSSEVFGALLTGWVIHRVIEARDQSRKSKSKNDEE